MASDGGPTMEFKELLARLAAFFTTWNVKYVPANQVNRLQIQLIGTEIHYLFNGQILCSIEILENPKIKQTLRINPGAAEQQILISILGTTRSLVVDSRLKKVQNVAERQEIVILLLRLYHSLEKELVACYPSSKKELDREFFLNRFADTAEAAQYGVEVEKFRKYLYDRVRVQEEPAVWIERREKYILGMSVTELDLILKASIFLGNEEVLFSQAYDLVRQISLY